MRLTLKRQGHDLEAMQNKLFAHEGTKEFEDFTNKAAKMKYQEDEILFNNLVKEEKARRNE